MDLQDIFSICEAKFKDHVVYARVLQNADEMENNYTQESLLHTKDLQENIFDEIVGRIKKDDETVPYLDNGYYYYSRYEEGKEYAIYCRKKGFLDAQEEILLDANEMAKGYDYKHFTTFFSWRYRSNKSCCSG